MKYLVLLFSFLGSFAYSADVGLLLGVSRREGSPSYLTYWIKYQNGKVTVAGPLGDWLVPVGKDWMRVGVRAGCSLQPGIFSNSEVYAVKASEVPKLNIMTCKQAVATLKKMKKKEPERFDDIPIGDPNEEGSDMISVHASFVTSKCLGTVEQSYYSGGAHPDQSLEYKTEGIGSAECGGVFAKLTAEDFSKEIKAIINAEEPDADGSKCTPEEGESPEWKLGRKNFNWVIEGFVKFHRLCGYNRHFTSDIKLLPQDVGPVVPAPIVKDLKGKDDAVISPDHQIVVALSGKELQVFTVNEEKIGKSPIFKKTIQDTGAVHMQEWVTGKYVETWDKKFSDLLKKGWKEPKFSTKYSW